MGLLNSTHQCMGYCNNNDFKKAPNIKELNSMIEEENNFWKDKLQTEEFEDEQFKEDMKKYIDDTDRFIRVISQVPEHRIKIEFNDMKVLIHNYYNSVKNRNSSQFRKCQLDLIYHIKIVEHMCKY